MHLGKAALEQALALNSWTLCGGCESYHFGGLVMFRSRSEKKRCLLLHYSARAFMEVNNSAVNTASLFMAILHWFHGLHYSVWLLLLPIAQEWQCVGSHCCVLCFTPSLVLCEEAGAREEKVWVQAVPANSCSSPFSKEMSSGFLLSLQSAAMLCVFSH